MNFEPQKFFIGVTDFFAIFLPGAVLTYLLKVSSPCWFPEMDEYLMLQGTEAWIVFLFASYLLGHILFLIGSWLDGFAYDPVRKGTDNEQITRLLHKRKLSPRVIRWLAGVCFRQNADAAVERIMPIKEDYLKRISALDAINAFQWCKARLAIEHPEALAIVNRFEADSKFFRSFIPVLLCWAVLSFFFFFIRCNSVWLLGNRLWVLGNRPWVLPIVLTILLMLSFWRYMEQRFKATQQAYWLVLSLEASRAERVTEAELPNPVDTTKKYYQAITHAGGVVFRQRLGSSQYLLVQASKNPSEWVLPKGHIEAGEDSERCAIREVKEETGVWARILQELRIVAYRLEDKPIAVRFYLMEAVGEGKPIDCNRRCEWLSLEEALKRATHNDTRDILRLAEQSGHA